MKDLHGFKILREQKSAELGADVHLMEHVRTGAQLLWIDSDETNKLFSIGFKTIPQNSTGVFHIIEHSVLNGSEKYPVKEPFVDLLKGSMNTFLNAMTFSDKTMYPVSSRNPRDFLNLVSVYLDAVFAPKILTNPNIFYQEGWHIEQDEDGKLSYKGVVFNEMKGAMSDTDRIIDSDLAAMLFPDNCYSFNSGGDPAVIPSLSYEEFVSSYRRFYHPSNAFIFLDGSIPDDDTFALIDSYLSRFDRLEDLPQINLQSPVPASKEDSYELAANEDEKNKNCLSVGKIIGSWSDKKKIMAAEVICGVLASYNEAPLTRALLSEGLVQDVSMCIEDGIAQPYMSLVMKNIKDGAEEEILKVIGKTVGEIASNGLDHDMIEAYINRLEFSMREKTEPAGLRRAVECMSSWLYGGDPMLYLENGSIFDEMRSDIENAYYENLLAEMFDGENTAVLSTKASKTRGSELREAEEAALAAIGESWSADDRAANAELNKALLQWQQTPDSPEARASLPELPLSEVSDEPEFTETRDTTVDGVRVLYHPIKTNGIIYFEMMFNLSDLSLDEIKEMTGLELTLGSLPTENHSLSDLEKDIKKYLGKLSFRISSAMTSNDTSECMPFLCVSCSVLEQNFDHAASLIKEILFKTRFDNHELIKNLIKQEQIRCKDSMVKSGHVLAMLVATSHYTASAAISESLSGYTHVRYIDELAAKTENDSSAFAADMLAKLRMVMSASRLIISVTSDNPVDIKPLTSGIPFGVAVPACSRYKSETEHDSVIRIPAQVGFSAQCIDLCTLNESYSGYLSVAAQIISYDYLWNEVRVQGGAYGTGLRASTDGVLMTYSFRDPSPEKSLQINKGMEKHLADLVRGGEKFDKYIISTIADSEPLIDAAARGALATTRYLRGITKQILKTWRLQMLRTGRGDLLRVARILGRFANDGAAALVTREDKE